MDANPQKLGLEPKNWNYYPKKLDWNLQKLGLELPEIGIGNPKNWNFNPQKLEF